MDAGIAALPMYDWPENRAETDAHWQMLRKCLEKAGVAAPAQLTRDVPGSVPHGIDALWRHPDLLLAQTCWGPLRAGLARHVRVVAQPSYDGIEGGRGPLYSSAIVVRRQAGIAPVPAPSDDAAIIPFEVIEGRPFAFNAFESMSGAIALREDFEAAGRTAPDLDPDHRTGGHRESIKSVARGQGDFAAIDCRSFQLALAHEPMARELVVVGWTRRRPGLPMITSLKRSKTDVGRIANALAAAGYDPVDTSPVP